MEKGRGERTTNRKRLRGGHEEHNGNPSHKKTDQCETPTHDRHRTNMKGNKLAMSGIGEEPKHNKTNTSATTNESR